MTARYLGQFNSFIPEATGQMIGFVRNSDSYKYNKIIQFVPTKKTVGVYAKMNTDDPQRLVSRNAFIWNDGSEAPAAAAGNQIRWDWTEFQCVRRAFPFRLGWMTIEQASLPVLQAHSEYARNQAMMDRVQDYIDAGETAGNWGNNTAAANTLNGGRGFLSLASSDRDSPNYLAIKKAFDEVFRRVHLTTNGVISQWGDSKMNGLMAIMSPACAIALSETSEIQDYLAQSPFALAQVKGDAAGQNAEWGLPDYLYTVKIVVEDAVRVYSNPTASAADASTSGGASAPRRYIKADNSIIFASRPGGISGSLGTPSFSTFQLYYYDQEMNMKLIDDPKHEYTEGWCVINDKLVLAAPQSGFLMTSVLS